MSKKKVIELNKVYELKLEEIEKLKKLLESGTYYYSINDLWIRSKVAYITNYVAKDYFEVFFGSGSVKFDINNIEKVYHPSIVVGKFKWCYLLKNNDNENIGYIGYSEF